MKKYHLLTIAVLIALSGCSHLRPKHCTEAREIAQQALDKANEALEEAHKSNKKANRMFQESQKK